MRAGPLDRRIAVYQPTVTPDPVTGEATTTWTLIGTVWGSQRVLPGSERYLGGVDQRVAWQPIEFLIRWSLTMAEIAADWQLVVGGRTFDVVSVAEVGRHEGIQIVARTRAEVAAA